MLRAVERLGRVIRRRRRARMCFILKEVLLFARAAECA